MDPRESLYTALLEQLMQIKEVRHVDLWNRQTDFMEEESPFEMPAVFVEFGDISWTILKGFYRGAGEIRLHTVLPWCTEAPVQAWNLTDQVWETLLGMSDKYGYWDALYPVTTMTNHDHGEVYENIDIFRVKYLKGDDKW